MKTFFHCKKNLTPGFFHLVFSHTRDFFTYNYFSRSGFHLEKRKKVKMPGGGMVNHKFESHIIVTNGGGCDDDSDRWLFLWL